MSNKFEYKTIELNNRSREDWVEELNELGEKRWEMINIFDGTVAILKKRKYEQPKV